MKSKKIVLLTIILMIAISSLSMVSAGWFDFLDFDKGDNMTIPENAKLVEYTGSMEIPVNSSKHSWFDYIYTGDKKWYDRDDYENFTVNYVMVGTSNEVIKNKTGENATHNFYKVEGESTQGHVWGSVLLNLTNENNINGSSKDLESIASAIKEIYNNSNNKELEKYEFPNALLNDTNISAFDGANAYMTFYKENGEKYKTKKLDDFIFNCKSDGSSYMIGFQCNSKPDYITDDLSNNADLYLILNSTNGAYELKVPLYYKPAK